VDVLVVVGSLLVVVGIVVAVTLAVRGERRGRLPIPPDASATVQQLRPQIVDLLRRGRAIHAIKMVRQATGVGLQEAKDLVDAIAFEEGIDPRSRPRR
jgi:ribosomal protein L7/L12